MSALRPSPTTPGAFLCPRCGSALRDGQAWCMECGLAARTRVHPPPSWRLPLLVTALVLALLATGIAFALVALLDEDEPAPTPVTVTVQAAPPAATTPTTPPVTVPTTTVPTTSTGATSTTGPGTTPTTGTTATGTTTTTSGALSDIRRTLRELAGD